MAQKSTLLVVPANDAEAAMIIELGRALGLDLWVSSQPHGATLEKEKELVPALKEGGYERAVIVEMPGPNVEKQIEKKGIELVVIDHHDYDGLRRAKDARGQYLPSSLEQFRKLFRLTDKKVEELGFDSMLVGGIGIMDRGFVWALQDAGYTKAQIKKVISYQNELMMPYRDEKNEEKKQRIAERAWEKRKVWNEFLVIEDKTDVSLRGRISLIIALEIGQPTPLILFEHGRGFIYVQETDYAEALFKKFGGFTFGSGRGWGRKNAGAKKKVSINDVLDFLGLK